MDSPVTDSSSSSEAGDSETESTTQSKKNQYTGTHPEMKYLKRGALCMTSEEFSDSGKQLLKREYVLDLRFPEAENTVEATGDLNESEFDAIRLNSWPILKALAKLPNVSVAGNYSQRSVPYVFWAPFSIFVENLGPLQEHLKKLKGAASNKCVPPVLKRSFYVCC
jgi:hypothetical protein